jgi:hypothetical protein
MTTENYGEGIPWSSPSGAARSWTCRAAQREAKPSSSPADTNESPAGSYAASTRSRPTNGDSSSSSNGTTSRTRNRWPLPTRITRCTKLRTLHWGTFLLLVLPTVLLGVLAGRFARLLVLVVLPIPIAWIWYRQSYRGPGDDVTGPIATISAVLDMGIFLVAATVLWLTRRAWRRPRSGDDLDLQ